MARRTKTQPKNIGLTDTQAGNLPAQLNPFVGREREIKDLAQLLSSASVENGVASKTGIGARLLTLTGPGGCGKTRLALQVARQLLAQNTFNTNIVWVELAALAEAALVPQAIATALKIRETPQRPLFETLLAILRPQQILLVLDNCEHLLPACTEWVQGLLDACPQLQILATSRAALDFPGEKVWLVPSLSLPESQSLAIATLTQSEAVRLFMDRAAEALPGFRLTTDNAPEVARICQRVDGMPLALELAAARMMLLSPQEIAARLDDSLGLLTHGKATLRPRQQTLRATLDWSYNLLSEPEQRLFRRLAVFAGGFTLEAVEAICGEPHSESVGLSRAQILDTLSELVDKSLVAATAAEPHEPRRFRLLEPIRQYALHQLTESGAASASRNRHLQYFQTLAETTFPYFTSAERSLWLKRLRLEADNLRAALRWALETPDQNVLGLRLAGDLSWFWFFSGLWSEGNDWLERFLKAVPDIGEPQTIRAQALFGLGLLIWGQGQPDPARVRLEEGTRAWRQLGPSGQSGLARTLGFQATTMMVEPYLARGLALQQEGATICRALNDQWTLGVSVSNLGGFARTMGDFDLAITYYEESIAILRPVGDQWMLSLPLMGLGRIAFRQEDYGRANELFKESLIHCRTLEEKWFISRCLGGLAAVAAMQGRWQAAARLFGADEALRQSMGPRMMPHFGWEVEHALKAIGPAVKEAPWLAAWAEGRALTVEQAMAYALGESLIFTPSPSDGHSPASVVVTAAQLAPLRIFALGQGRVIRGNQELVAADWGYAKPRELLFYLLCHQPKPQTKAQIGLALWPEASPTQLRQNLGVALHTLRRVLGHPDWIIFEKGHYSFNRSLPYWFDVETFETQLTEMDRLPPNAPESMRLPLEEALTLWPGDLLEDFVESDWHLLRREELRRRYLQALFQLGEFRFDSGRYTEAAQAYRQALEHDNLLEDGHRALMRCYARLGERGQALRQYETVAALMRTELNATPAPETTALYERLRQGAEV